ncbi:hypothetical protein BDV33DRAFT_199512 [Aspergillus novoparasiticus]|uniref:non-specific serine/threonine protein kinase n=1 Tax=Aspergillus novoparasiticus TaxID=986946 RepID=A0A5N6F487_9EURO|nr:hypothetical protein BDV33DRAFT_199512 [Aspergillus novoparasiticus]
MAKTRMQIERIKHLSPLPTDDFYSETDEALAEEQDDVWDTCYSLEELVSYIFPPPREQHEAKLLYHDDLSASNILVDPEATEYPFFLRGIDVQEPPPPPIPGTIEPELREIRKDWEKVRLRRLYTQTLQNDNEVSPDIMRKHKFSDCLENIEINWTASRYWARGVLQKSQVNEEGTTPKTPDSKRQT